MGLRVVRRLVVLMTVLLLGLGVVARDAMAADMAAKVIAASVEMSDSNACEPCGSDASVSTEDCHMACNSPTAVLPPPGPPYVVAAGQPAPGVTPEQTGRPIAPEPHPPEPAILT